MNTLLGIVVLSLLYFLPYLVAKYRFHHQITAIAVLNLLAGWTVLGWIVALVWACTQVRPSSYPVQS